MVKVTFDGLVDVKKKASGEVIITLDSKDQTLFKDDTVILNGTKVSIEKPSYITGLKK